MGSLHDLDNVRAHRRQTDRRRTINEYRNGKLRDFDQRNESHVNHHDADTVTHADTLADAEPNPDSLADADTNADPLADADTNADGDSDSNSDAGTGNHDFGTDHRDRY